MPTRNQLLADKTFKNTDDLGRRVYYTLTDTKGQSAHRVSKLLSLLVVKLSERGQLSETELDDILLETIA